MVSIENVLVLSLSVAVTIALANYSQEVLGFVGDTVRVMLAAA
ncbi:MAG: hypothetical protein AAGI50_15180 [Pseudomonadota bacterium]